MHPLMNAASLKLAGFAWVMASSLTLTACGSKQSGPSDVPQASSNGDEVCQPLAASQIVYPNEVEIPIVGPNRGKPITYAKVWSAPASKKTIIYLSGGRGGYDEPADAVYSRMAAKMAHHCVSSVFVAFRDEDTSNQDYDQDVLSAVEYARAQGSRKMVFMGWSFSGAIVADMVTRVPEMVSAVLFATQGADTGGFRKMNANQSILMFHSKADKDLESTQSEIVYDEIPDGVEKVYYPLNGFDHALKGASKKIDPLLEAWLLEKL
ncbi:MAG: hypothetical protein H7222_07170 [Methylotenera sp.]|nr:hypothetical protein [Oligoflexia bacterium]